MTRVLHEEDPFTYEVLYRNTSTPCEVHRRGRGLKECGEPGAVRLLYGKDIRLVMCARCYMLAREAHQPKLSNLREEQGWPSPLPRKEDGDDAR